MFVDPSVIVFSCAVLLEMNPVKSLVQIDGQRVAIFVSKGKRRERAIGCASGVNLSVPRSSAS
jgi:hypothetical protein